MTEDLDATVRRAGFADAAEFHRLVASVDLTTPGAFRRFEEWKRNDGTKAGLLKVDTASGTPAQEP